MSEPDSNEGAKEDESTEANRLNYYVYQVGFGIADIMGPPAEINMVTYCHKLIKGMANA